MKIANVKIENFRAIRDLNAEFKSVTSFIGYNGGGKSSILKAIEWFFDGFPLEDTDFFIPASDKNRPDRVTVEVTFEELNLPDKKSFGKYARGDRMKLKRAGFRDGSSKLYGQPIVCKDFDEIRNVGPIAEKRKLYSQFCSMEKFNSLNNEQNMKAPEIEFELEKWESDPANAVHLSAREAEESSYFFGAVGSGKLRNLSGFIFVPAAPDLTGQFDSNNKGSAMELLVGNLVKSVVGDSISKWQSENQSTLDALELAVQESSKEGLKSESSKVNQFLRNYLPGAEFVIDIGLADWKPKAVPLAESSIRHNDRKFQMQTQGHGVQRATLLALLQAVAEKRVQESAGEGDADESSLIVCIEEPEVYQHPVQARMLSNSFRRAAATSGIQFIFATHSPYFVDPNYLTSTFRVTAGHNGSIISGAKPTHEYSEKNKFGELEKYYTKNLIEGLFSRACLIVEGDTDQLVFSNLREKNSGRTLGELGISVIDAEGGNNLKTIASMMISYGVPVFLLHDGDSSQSRARRRAERKFESKASAGEDVSQDIFNQTDQLLASWKKGVSKFCEAVESLNLRNGIEDFEWGGGACVGEFCAILEDDLETELESWDSFMQMAKKFQLGEDLRATKKAGVYSKAVMGADVEDCPEVLNEIIRAVVNLADQGISVGKF